ncbi:MAG: hypothetical protein AAF621_03895, partial [Pseudomonadota bacterium]
MNTVSHAVSRLNRGINLIPFRQNFYQVRPSAGQSNPVKAFFSSTANGLNDIAPGTVLTKDQVKELVQRNLLIMRSGAHAGVKSSGSENWHTQQFMQATGLKDGETLLLPETYHNGQALAAIYARNGHPVIMQEASKGLRDCHYSTDQIKSFVHIKQNPNGTFKVVGTRSMLPHFMHEDRQQETKIPKILLSKSKRKTHQMKNIMEFGDTRLMTLSVPHFPSGAIFAGLANTVKVNPENDKMETIGRSTPKGHEEFKNFVHKNISDKVKFISMDLKQPFYHFDTVGFVTEAGHFFTCKEAFTDEGWKKLQNLFGDKLVQIPVEDISGDKKEKLPRFGGNATSFGNNIYISDRVSDKMTKAMTDKGYNVFLTP